MDSLLSVQNFESSENEVLTYCDIAYLAHRYNIPVAIEYGQKAIDLASSLKNDTLLAKSYQDAGYAYLSNSQPEVYLDYSQKALGIFENLNDSLKVAKARSNVAIAYQELGMLEEAMQSYHKALPYFISKHQDYYVAVLKNNIGNLLHQTGQLEESAKFISESAESLLTLGDTSNFLIASANAAATLDKVGKHSEAKALFEKAYNFPYGGSRASKTEAMRGLGVIEEREGNFQNAQNYFKELLAVYEQIGAEGSTGFVLARLGRTELELGDIDSAEIHIMQAVKAYENSSSWEDLKHLQTQVSRLHELKGDYKRAFEAQSLVRIYEDSMLNVNSQTEIIQLEKQLEVLEKDQEILEKGLSLEQEQNISLKKSRTIMGLIGLGVLG
ncbi:MAG: tetratricopeptide repeat protein, partial [Flavobacteriales bacterium]